MYDALKNKADIIVTIGFIQSNHVRQAIAAANLYGLETHVVLYSISLQKFTKSEINKVAQMAQNGIGRVIRPAHTMFDGDIVFSLSCGEFKADVNLVGDMAASVLAQAIISTVEISNELA